MALPQQVIDRLSRDRTQTSGWSSGLLFFSFGILFLMFTVYFGIVTGFEPYLNTSISQLQKQIDAASMAIPADQQSALLNFYSQITNLQKLLKNHMIFTPFFSWLEKNTEAKTFYSKIMFSSGNQISITVLSRTQADMNQQLAIFESAPEVSNINVSNVAPTPVNKVVWQQANVTLFMKPSVFSYSN